MFSALRIKIALTLLQCHSLRPIRESISSLRFLGIVLQRIFQVACNLTTIASLVSPLVVFDPTAVAYPFPG